jgi:hypothetical protein
VLNTHDHHLFAIRPSKRFGPSNLSRVPLHLEVFVTFGRAKPKSFCVVANEHGAMTRVGIDGTKVALFDTHDGPSRVVLMSDAL